LSKKNICILTPCYNDFESLRVFLAGIDAGLGDLSAANSAPAPYQISVVVINDGSTDVPAESFCTPLKYRNITRVEQIDLIRNMGHQRAISIGLAYINGRDDGYDGVVVMDCDGEDSCPDVFHLIDGMSDDAIIFAKRRKRSESFAFRISYFFYRLFFKILTGYRMYGGNFSLIPKKLLPRVVHHGDIWNHYHAGILKSKLKLRYIECDRGCRYSGKSKMNFVSLVVHGFSSVSVFNESVFVRLVLLSLIFLGLSGVVISTVLILKFVLHAATPGWSTSAIGITAILCIQFLLIVLNFAFLSLGSRNIADFLPAHNYKNYMLNIETVKETMTEKKEG
jgi:glycosyltransferase involved in cell wall biosynthesis